MNNIIESINGTIIMKIGLNGSLIMKISINVH